MCQAACNTSFKGSYTLFQPARTPNICSIHSQRHTHLSWNYEDLTYTSNYLTQGLKGKHFSRMAAQVRITVYKKQEKKWTQEALVYGSWFLAARDGEAVSGRGSSVCLSVCLLSFFSILCFLPSSTPSSFSTWGYSCPWIYTLRSQTWEEAHFPIFLPHVRF